MPIEEFDKKKPSRSCKHDILVFGGAFRLLGGIFLGVQCEGVRAEVLRPILLPDLIRRGLGREGTWIKVNRLHDSKALLLWGRDARREILCR